jgi:4-amino-4-deoxy-L-arabinose transferase-like glycosyltransferase
VPFFSHHYSPLPLAYNRPVAAQVETPASISASRPVARIQRDWLAALIIICGLLAFTPNLTSYFLSDDFVLLSWTHNIALSDVGGFFDPQTFWFYRPLVKVFYWAGQALFGLHATPFHLISLLLHGANAYLLYRLIIRAGGLWIAGISTALLFLLNPHHAEAVSWIASIGDLLGVFALLSAFALFQRYLDRRNYLYLVASVAMFALGLLSRETAIMLPMLLFVYMLLFRHRYARLSANDYLAITQNYGLVLGLYVGLQVSRITSLTSTGTQSALQFHQLNPDSILLGILDYVHGLVPGGNLLAQLPLDVLRVLVWVEWALLALLAVILWRTRQHLMLFGLLCLLVTPLVFIFFSGPTDRYFYLPSVGYSIFVGALLAELPAFAARWTPATLMPNPRPALVLSGMALALLLAGQGIALLFKEAEWKVAGGATGGVFHDVRQAVSDPHDYSAFYFVGLPDFMAGVPTFQNALPQAVQLIYDNPTLQVVPTTCEQLQQIELPRYSFFFRFKGDGVEQFANRGDCR